MNKKTHKSIEQLFDLLNDLKFHDGNSIGEILHITRSAVWKHIHKLIELGVPIESDKLLGYRLARPVYLLNEEKLTNAFPALKDSICVYSELTSTNDYLARHAINTPALCLAERQTAGRGRLARSWFSPYAENIYCSYAFPFKKDVSQLAGLSLSVSLALVNALKKIHITDGIKIKWPNDIVYVHPITQQLAKLAGVLIDIKAESHGVSKVIIGLGLNVNMQKASKTLPAWTSLSLITQQIYDRNTIVIHLIKALQATIKQFEKNGFEALVNEWNKYDCLQNQKITVQNFDQEISGLAKGVNSQGNLLLQVNKKILTISSGDASLKKK